MQLNLFPPLDPRSAERRQKLAGAQVSGFLQSVAAAHPSEPIMFICIGTDRSTGDALGPLVGTRLRESGWTNVIGCLDEPCDSSNLEARLAGLPDNLITIAIDACLGHPSTVGYYLVGNQPLLPAESVGMTLPAVGRYSIAAVVNTNGPKPYWTLQTTSLRFVMKMAHELADAILQSFPDNHKE
ncbi:sporulation protein [Paenibacillus dendritiformis]|uniref:spore protease YyaC n=1 Tax=Paenibacillus dendritiformis TaxID=130049 RepID=UPI0018CE3A1D|nr:spore protease YyaC [Paenibacillus dendritiformis]MBG9791918.1 sporulation protein [Paenibacillus dendritiformis]